MAVFYNSETGQYDVESQSLNPIAEAAFLANEARLHTGTGWHEYSSVAAMNAAVAANHWPRPQQNNNPATAAAQQATGTASHAATQAARAASGALSGWTIGGVSGHNLMIRALKIIIGSVMLVVGVVKLTGADTAALGVASKLPGV